MARTDDRLKIAYNSLLDHCDTLGKEEQLPSELALAKKLTVSRTLIRSALQKLNDNGIIRWNGRKKVVIRQSNNVDRLDVAIAPPSPDELERSFFDWILRFDVPAGTALNVTKLSRDFHVAPHALQEFLASLSRFGLVNRRSRGGWELVGFTESFSVELSDFRSVLELNAISVLLRQDDGHPIWAKLKRLKQQHLDLAENIETGFHDFSRLDEDFHNVISSVVTNRFVTEFQRVITLIFHYHYQWEKDTERDRNTAALKEHLILIEALQARDKTRALAAAKVHLGTAKKTLLASLRSHEFT